MTKITSRDELANAFQESDARLRDAIESIRDGFALYDADELFVYCNSQYRDFYPSIADMLMPGARLEDLARTAYEAGDIRGSFEIVEARIEERLSRYRKGQGNHEQQLKDGRWLLCSDRRTSMGGIACIRTEITEHKRAVVALRESEERYKNLFASAEVSIWNEDFSKVREALDQLRRDGVSDLRQHLGENEQLAWDLAAMVKVNNVNEATLKLFHAKSEEEFLNSIDKSFGPDAIDTFIDELCAIWEKKRNFRSEATFLTLGGEKITAILSMPIPETDKGFENVPVSILDISERKPLEDRLNEAARIAKLGNWIWDEVNDRIMDCSEGFARIYGLTVKEILALDFGELNPLYAHPDDVDWLQKVYTEYRDNPKVYDIEYRINRPDGSLLYVHAIGTPILNEEGQIVRTFGITQDITEHKQLEERLRQSQKMEAVGQLTGGVAHDFNTLLAIIMGNAQLLEDKIEDDTAREMLGSVIRATQRGAELISRLLAFSRRQPLKPMAIDIGELCVRMTVLLRRTLGETIEIDLQIGELSLARADPGQLESALLNLSLNARDAMPGGGKLTIEAENITLSEADMNVHPDGQPGDYAVLKVSDTGTGIPPAVLDKVFEPFFTTKGVEAGSGLGLSMVYGFAHQSDGHITIESEKGHGTTVALYLPLAEEIAEYAQREAADQAVPRGQGETILVVEDEPELRQIIVRQLEGLGYKVLEAPDGPVALTVLADSPEVDLLFSDVVLPGGINGPEIYHQAKGLCPNLKCLFMSGYAATTKELLPEGDNLLTKPFDIADLAQELRSVLGT